MTTTQMDTQTDYYAKSDSTSFPAAEKLAYYVEADGILNGLIIKQQEDRAEEEWTKTTVASQSNYLAQSRLHNIKWLKIDYGDGFIPCRHFPENELVEKYGTALDSVLASWPASDPIYHFKGKHLFVYPAPTAAQAGTNRLKGSVELLPADLDRSTNTTPELVPANYHYLHAAYAAMSWLDEDDPLWKKAKRKWDEGVVVMLESIYPRAWQAETNGGYPEDDGSEY